MSDPLGLAPLFEGGGEPWMPLLKPVIEQQSEAETFIGQGRDKTIVPVRELTFQALKPNPPAKWRVVVFGQNPYPRVESATGIAMFDNSFTDWQDPLFGKVTSIRCIIKAACIHKHKIEKATSTAEVRRLLTQNNAVAPPEWFQAMLAQGVLLLNAALTASSDESLSTARHTKFWKPVVERIVEEILKAKAESGEGVVFAWWGNHAKALRTLVEKLEKKYNTVPVKHVDHCNPAAMGDSFCNGDHFGAINDALAALKIQKVDWLPAKGWNQGGAHDQAEQKRLSEFIEKTRELHRLYLERLQGVGDEQLEELAPLEGVLALPLPTLGDVAGPLTQTYPALSFYMKEALKFATKVKAQSGSLTDDEIAALFLYTTESILYKQLNAMLRDKDRNKAREWYPYLRLFLSAFSKLEQHDKSLYRGVHKDLRKEYPKGRTITWWGISSCTPSLAVAQGFLGSNGRRTLFEVRPRSAVSIMGYSAFTGEQEYVLAPGTRLRVEDVSLQKDLCKVVLTECEGPRLVG